MGFLKKKDTISLASAAINDDCLIVSLPDAIEPKVWRLDLEKAKDSSFEVKKEEKSFSLIVKKSARSKPDIIGQFETKQEALSALLMISEALKTNKTKSIAPAKEKITKVKKETPAKAQEPANSNNRGVVALLSTLLVIGIVYYFWTQSMPSSQSFETRALTTQSAADPSQPQTGVPMSADDFLQGF